MFMYAERFARKGHKDLDDLQKTLLEFYHDREAPFDKASYTKVKIIIRRGSAFCLLMGEPPFSATPQALARQDGIMRSACQILGVISILYEVARRPEYASFIVTPPVPLEQIFLWVEFLHPMNGRPFPLQGVATYKSITSLSMMIRKILVCDEDYVAPFIRNNPRAMFLVMDLWAHCTTYLRGSGVEHLAQTIRTVSDSLNAIVIAVVSDDASKSAFAHELNQAVGGNTMRLFQHIAAQTRFLERTETPVSEITVWSSHFRLARTLLFISGCTDAVSPRRFMRQIISGAQYCLQPQTTARTRDAMREAASLAADVLWELITGKMSTQNIIHAVKEGMFCLFVQLRMNFGDIPNVLRLGITLLNSFWLPTVLRAFRSRYKRALDCDKVTLEQGKEVASAFHMHWDAYSICKEIKPWMHAIPCHGDAIEHCGSGVKPCICGEVFYCSQRCQRRHWYAHHREECCFTENGVWRLKGAITLKDATFLIDSAQSAIARDLASGEMATQLAGHEFLPGEQPCICVYLGTASVDILPDAKAIADEFLCPLVRIEGARCNKNEGSVTVQLCLRMGKHNVRTSLPFVYSLEQLYKACGVTK
ncbi:hypothetical protein BD626DRAFT_482795 [Schizophyllum amplum]|uniref:MYND-type domain-containing protein n=1 Tax=Schizophyllum amplum TaxID=97359 RepID=A0A550CNX0_9AGAR|nr:hypothetical protein BD626DRAFT_482795 [Auriculariopsis ampla]